MYFAKWWCKTGYTVSLKASINFVMSGNFAESFGMNADMIILRIVCNCIFGYRCMAWPSILEMLFFYNRFRRHLWTDLHKTLIRDMCRPAIENRRGFLGSVPPKLGSQFYVSQASAYRYCRTLIHMLPIWKRYVNSSSAVRELKSAVLMYRVKSVDGQRANTASTT